MPEWLIPALKGLVFGTSVALLNHFILIKGMKKAENKAGPEAKNTIAACYGIRYVLNIAALLLVHNNSVMLIAAALGLTAPKNLFIYKSLKNGAPKKI